MRLNQSDTGENKEFASTLDAIDRGMEDVANGNVRPFREVMEELSVE